MGRAALLIPFPFAVDNHQLRNAKSLERAGAATVMTQRDATPLRIAQELARLAKADVRVAMARASMALGRPEAAVSIARDLLELAASAKRPSRNYRQELT